MRQTAEGGEEWKEGGGGERLGNVKDTGGWMVLLLNGNYLGGSCRYIGSVSLLTFCMIT